MKYLLFTIFSLLILNFTVDAQPPDLNSESSKKADIKNKEIVIQLTPYGYISLPKGYWAYMDYNMMDAWGGIIESLDKSFKIRFSDGIIVSVLDDKTQNLKWKKEARTEENFPIIYALTDSRKTKRILAKIQSANFSAQIKDDSDIETFLRIIKNYRRGKCEKCFYSGYTKGLKKFFERQIKK